MKAKKSIMVILFSTALLFTFMSWSTVFAYSTDAETKSSILYVKSGANGTCGSWVDACELQTALFNAVAGDQIWVAAGTYKPSSSNRSATFQLISGVAIYGGFPAAGGEWFQRNWVSNLTTLSGDIGLIGNNGDNSFHVVTGSGVDASAILDGFSISGGNAIYDDNNNIGGGMYNNNGSPTLRLVTFSDNNAYKGGGMSNDNSSSPNLSNVTLSSNSALYGGGMYNGHYSNPNLTNVTFSDNTAVEGGGMSNDNSSPTLTLVTFSGNAAIVGGGMKNGQYSSPSLINVTFSGNIATTPEGSGGGMFSSSSSPSLTNVTFSGNTANYNGGGMYNSDSSPTLDNVTFSANAANLGGGMYNYINSSPTVTNSILWGNTPDQIHNDTSSSATVTYSVIDDESYSDPTNILTDPSLGPLADNGGLTLTHALGEGSPAIDAGNPLSCPSVDQRGYVRPIDGDGGGTASCDMGAYEYASYPATFSLTLDLAGSGSVLKEPDKSEYLWGEVVTLTPIADPDWVFIGWGGDASGMDNPLTVTIYEDTNITANFRFDAWTITLSVYPESSGNVLACPDQPTYHYGDQVTLTALPNPGWSFIGWTGDASGTSSQVIVTMNDNLEITANFAQIEYTLSVSVNPPGMGTVTKSPNKPYYNYGDVVTLTANGVTGWWLESWSGDASGNSNPLTFTVVGNSTIVANFTDTYHTYLPAILK